MPLKKIILSSIIISLLACNKSVTNLPELQNTGAKKYTNTDINTWIYDNMKAYYLWPDNLPAITNTNTASNPMDYFYSILYNYHITDRFSWIDSSSTNLINQLNGINTVLGI